MKKKFSWYFPKSEGEINKIWDRGVLTVDANVLLDLYRYHEDTRSSLMASLESFKGRLWICHQAAHEFFKNRHKVIISSSKAFKQGDDELVKIRKSAQTAIDQLGGNRLIPKEIIGNLSASIDAALNCAESELEKIAQKYPNYLVSDPILDKLLTMFDGAVGDPFTDEEWKPLKSEAELRRKNKVPPGYMDDEKDGERPLGDFILWRQILDYSKKSKSPIIFVTSERKEDWWEKYAGQTIGPRQELLKEASDYSGQDILAYQTDRFLEFFSQRTGGAIDKKAVDEIRAVDDLRTNAVKFLAQSLVSASGIYSEGEISVELKRPVQNFTASGHFDPQLTSIPRLRVALIQASQELPLFRLSAGTGTTHDFNIHLRSSESGVLLPTGNYIFRYVAECENNGANVAQSTVLG